MAERREMEVAKMRPRAHSIHIDNRMRISVTGVVDVESFNEQEVMLLTEAGPLNIAGVNLHLSKLNLEDGQICIEGEILNHKGITLNLSKHEVLKNNEKIDLTLKEFELLKLLLQHKGKVLSRNYLLDKIWGYEYYGETRTVDVHIRYLRKKIEDDSEKYIETIRGVGYKIN